MPHQNTLAKAASLPYTWGMLTYPINLTNGPGPLLAFLADADPAAIAATAVALANTDGGALVIGLDSRGVPSGPVDGAAVARALREAGTLCNPPLRLDRYELVAARNGPVVAIRVGRGTRVHALHDGRVMVRAGGTNRALNGGEIRALISNKSSGDFETEIVPGARPGDLDPARLAALMRRCGNGCEGSDLLLAMGAITPEASVTVAGVLLFGRDPQRWLPHSGARFVHYLAGGHVAVERAVGGPLVQIVDDLGDLVAEQQRTPVDGRGDENADYPEAVVREALVNAVCHRDYRRRRESVRVCLHPDRLEITSPGGLPGFLTTSHLLDGRYSRNPRLNWGLFQWGYVTEPGQGVLRMIMGMDGRGAQPPEFDAGRDRVTVRLYRTTESAIDPAEITLNERQRAALEYVRGRGSITLHEFRTLCPAVQPSVLQRDLRALVAADLLRKVGRRSGAYYILP
jgi:ATP-dependent DNA helicase RecG